MAAAAPHRGDCVETLTLGACTLATTARPDESPGVTTLGTFGDVAVAFTGSLDNADELVAALPAIGESPAPTDIGGLLVHAWRAWGDDLPGHLRGVFAAALTDGRRLVAFRDHVGYRPLFYRHDGPTLLAASEVKQVLAGAGIAPEPDLDVVTSIFFRTVDDDTPTALRGARRLPKASVLTADAGSEPRIRRYWEPSRLLEARPVAPDELLDRFTFLFDRAVRRMLGGADGVSLSGGIDSPAIAASAAVQHREAFGTPLHAISITYPRHPAVDERHYVELIADALEIPLHLFEQHANPLADMERWVRLVDTPYPGAALSQYEEDYGHARELGLRTMLTGEHAEFVFAMQWYTLDHFLTHGRFGAAARQLRARRRRGDSVPTIARLIARSLASDRVMDRWNAVLRRTAPQTLPAWIDARRTAADELLGPHERWRSSQLTGFSGPGISLEAEEVCQAVSGVISRKPWTDIDLWELFLGLPAEQKFPDLRPKGLVRTLLRGRVPDVILDRTDKTVFDQAALAEVDYAELTRLLGVTRQRLPGVDYAMLLRLVDARTMRPIDYMWARNLANAHAFLAQWDGTSERTPGA